MRKQRYNTYPAMGKSSRYSHRRRRHEHKHKNKQKRNRRKSKCHCKVLKACSATISNATITNADIANATIGNANIATETVYNSTITNAVVRNLDVETINGRTVECGPSFVNRNSQLVRVVYEGDPPSPVEPTNPGQFDQDVWDTLWDAAVLNGQEMQGRIHCGRLQVKLIQDRFGCVQCPPDGYENCHPTCPEPPPEVCACPDEHGVCPPVPLLIFGTQTVQTFYVQTCGDLATDTQNQLVSTVSFGLDVTNVTGSLATRVVSVLVHGAYIDTDGNLQYQVFDMASQQFDATLDTALGVRFSGTVVIPTDFTQASTLSMPDFGEFGAIQVVVYAEDGVDIDQVPSAASDAAAAKSKKMKTTRAGRKIIQPAQDQPGPGPVDVQTQVSAPATGEPQQIQNANVQNTYFAGAPAGDPVVTIEYDLTIEQSGNSMQWVQVYKYIGAQNGSYVGINTNENGVFQILWSVWDATTASAEQPYVAVIPFGGEGAGISLRVPPENIGFFPIVVGQQYTFRVNRRSVTIDNGAVWELIVTNQTTSQTATFGTITTRAGIHEIDPLTSLGQFVEAFGLSPPLTCDTLPQTVSLFSFPRLTTAGSVVAPIFYMEWVPPPDHCGAFRKELIDPNTGPVRVFYRA